MTVISKAPLVKDHLVPCLYNHVAACAADPLEREKRKINVQKR